MDKRREFSRIDQKPNKILAELRRRHGFSPPKTVPEQTHEIMEFQQTFKDHFRNEQKKRTAEIIPKFIQNYQLAKKVRALLTSLSDGYEHHQEDLKNHLSVKNQLKAMRIFLEKGYKDLQGTYNKTTAYLENSSRLVQVIETVKANCTDVFAYYKWDRVSHLGDQPKTGDVDPEVLRVAHPLVKDLLVGETPLTAAIHLSDQFMRVGIATPEELAQYTAELEKVNVQLQKRIFEVASNWDEVRLFEVPGENAKQYNDSVTRLRPCIEEMKQLLTGQTDDGRRQIIGQYMLDCKKSILELRKLIYIYNDNIDISDIFRECDTKINTIENAKIALRAQKDIMQTKQEADEYWAKSSPEVQSQMEMYFARCLKSLENYRLALDQFFADQQGERKKILNIDSNTRVNTKLSAIGTNMVDMHTEMRRAINTLILRKKEARSNISEDDQKALKEYKNESKRYWERTEIFINKASINRIFKKDQRYSPEKLLTTLKQNAYLKERYEGAIGLWDRRTCGEHAEIMLTLFESCYGRESWECSLLTKNEFRLLLALKDIDKSKPSKIDGIPSQTNEHTRHILPKILQWLEIPKEKGEIILSLATQEYIHEYMGCPNAAIYAKHMASEAARLGIETQEYFQLSTISYMCDVGSDSAGGRYYQDPRFEFHYDSNKQLTKMKFSQQTQETFNKLVDCISDGQDNVGLDLGWVSDTGMAVGGSFTSGQIKALGHQQISNVVDAREELCDDEDALARANIRWLHLPTPDRHAMSVEQLVEGTKWVMACREKRERVLIHCEFGMGRSVLLTAAVLVALGKTAREAPELIRRNRRQTNLTPPQFRRLQEFEDHWKQLQLVPADTADRKPDYLAEPVRHLVLYTLQQGDLDQALTYAQQGLSLREAANFKTNLPFDHLLLSTIYQAKGDTTNALLHAQKASAIASKMEFEEAVVPANKHLERINEQDGYQIFSLNTAKSFITAYNNLSYVDDGFHPLLESFDTYISDPEKLPSLANLENMHKELQEQVKKLKPSDEPSQKGIQEQDLTTFTLEQTQKLEKAIQDMKNADGLPKAKTLGNDGRKLLKNMETLLDADDLPKAETLDSDGKQLLKNMEALFNDIVQKKNIVQKGGRLETVSRWISDSMQVHLDLKNAIESADTQLRLVMKDRHFAFDTSVQEYQKDLEVARLYRDRSDAPTRTGLKEQTSTLEAHRIQLDEALEKRTQQEVEKWSEWSKDVRDVSHTQPEHSMIRTFPVVEVLDFECVATDIAEALKQGSLEDIYRELQALQWEPEAVNEVKTMYQRNFDETLETALRDRLRETAQLEHALQYINQGVPIEPLPASFENLATSLNAELAKPTVEPEEIYRILASFRRSTEPSENLDVRYMRKFRTSLQSDIEKKLKGKSKDYALYLIGDPTMEKPVRSCKEAVRLCKALSELPVHWDDGISGPLTYDIPFGSELRAHIMSQVLKEMGYASKKCFAHSVRLDNTGQFQGNLQVHTLLASDIPSSQELTVPLKSHVALHIPVETPFGVRELLQDSCLSDRPLTVKKWASKMGQDDFKRLSFEEYKAELERNPNFLYSTAKMHIFTTSRSYFSLPTSDAIASLEAQSQLISDYRALSTYNTTGRKILIDTASQVPYYEIAGFIHKNSHTIHDDVSAKQFFNDMATNLFKKVGIFGFRFISHTNFSDVFPNRYQDLKTQLVETNVSAPIVEYFESLLSSNSIFSGAHRDQDSFSADSVRDIAILEAASKQRELSETFEQAKKEYLKKRALKTYDRTKKMVDSYRKTHTYEIMQIEKYFNICVSNLQDCISEVEKCDSEGSSFDILSQKIINLFNSDKETRKALTIIEFRKRYSTARDILTAYNPPKELLEWHAKYSSQHWEKMARKRAKKEIDHKVTDKEFEEYYKDYLKRLDNHGLDLVEPEDTEIRIRRRAHKVIEILERGRILSMFETQTVGGETVGAEHQAQIEKNLYSFPLDYPDELRPLYTAVTKGSYANDVTRRFGAAAIKLKPSVQQRTTKVMYDSSLLAGLGIDSQEDFLTARPVPFNKPGRDCFPLTDPDSVYRDPTATKDEKTNSLTVFSKKDPLEFATPNDIKPFLEGHIHQALTIDDIERIDFSDEFDYELREGLDKTVNDEQKEALRSVLSDAEEHEIENIEKKGFGGVIYYILSMQRDHGQINKELLEMSNRSREALMQLAEEHKKTLKELLDKRGIAYSFYSPTYTDKAVQ